MLVESCCITDNSDNSVLLVEGAGGFYSPIADQALNSDLAIALNLPIILVTEDRLGAVNQLLLARHAILDKGLTISCIILNKHEKHHLKNLESISNRVTEQVIPIPLQKQPIWKAIAKNLTEFEPCPFPL